MTASSPHSETVTDGIRVHAAAEFRPDESDPDAGQHIFAYRITLTNEGEIPARLLTRHWIILDADNERREVRGSGVVGENPELLPGGTFSYMSSCPLRTKWGTMEGSYTFERPDGERFDVAIGRFFLAPTAPPLKQPI